MTKIQMIQTDIAGLMTLHMQPSNESWHKNRKSAVMDREGKINA